MDQTWLTELFFGPQERIQEFGGWTHPQNPGYRATLTVHISNREQVMAALTPTAAGTAHLNAATTCPTAGAHLLPLYLELACKGARWVW